MDAKDLRILFVLMIVSFSMIGLACASNRLNLLKDGTFKFEPIPSKNYYISYVNVYQNDNELVLRGHVKRRSRVGGGSGHVDIAILSPDGDVLEQISTLHRPQIILTRRMHNRKSTFEVRLPTIPPAGSIFRVAYHRESKGRNKTFDCGKNTAFARHNNLKRSQLSQ